MRPAKKIRAFTLTEILLCLLVSTLLFGGVACAAHLYELALYAIDDLDAAQKRIEQVVAILLPITEMCGYGLPKDATQYKNSFGVGAVPPFDWAGPLSILEAIPGREASRCRMVYAIPSGVRTTQETRTTDFSFDVYATAAPDNLEPQSGPPNSTKNWAIFAAATPHFQPVRLMATPSAIGSGARLSLRRVNATEELLLPRNDELFYLRAADMQVRTSDPGTDREDWILYTNDQTGGTVSVGQPRVAGVVDARFEPDAGGRLLRVTLLVRGDRRYDREITNHTPDGWPAKWAGDIPKNARRYRLYAHSVAFDLKNF